MSPLFFILLNIYINGRIDSLKHIMNTTKNNTGIMHNNKNNNKHGTKNNTKNDTKKSIEFAEPRETIGKSTKATKPISSLQPTRIQEPSNSLDNKPTSKLSRGPKNPLHKSFVASQDSINTALCDKISCRRVDVKAKELCDEAGIARPTFYLHCRNASDAKKRYEQRLEDELHKYASSSINRDVFYIVLTSHVAKNQKYFSATAKGGDHYLLGRIIKDYRHNLVGENINERAFRQYVGAVIVAINCWLELDGITPQSTAACVRELKRIRPMRW